jgi:transcriptional regulator with XRE-family HTH domain
MRRQKVAMAFGRVLRELRHARGLSQEQLAALGDFDRTYPSLLERGLRTPTLSVVFRIADVLGIAPSALVAKVDETKPPCATLHPDTDPSPSQQ